MYRIAAVGDKDSVLGFKALGVDVFHDVGTDWGELVHELAKRQYAVILITEEVMESAAAAVERYESQPVPAIIPIPGSRGARGIGMHRIRKAAEKAIGADILFKEK